MKKFLVLILPGVFCNQCEKSKNNSQYDNVDIINNTDFTLVPSSDSYEPTKDSFNFGPTPIIETLS